MVVGMGFEVEEIENRKMMGLGKVVRYWGWG